MHMKKIGCVVAIAGVTSLSVAGCAEIERETGLGQKAQIGAGAGAAGGGLLAAAVGASPLGIAAGVILGGIAGGALGNYLDNRDKEAALQAQQAALQQNRQTAWENPDTGHRGTYQPTRTYTTQDGKTCRDFVQTVTIDGKTEQAVGTACKMPDGSWRVHNA